MVYAIKNKRQPRASGDMAFTPLTLWRVYLNLPTKKPSSTSIVLLTYAPLPKIPDGK